MTDEPIDPKFYSLYDKYCHGQITRREFFDRAASITVGGISALAIAESLMPKYANAETVSFTDERITPHWVDYPSPGGTSGSMRGYLVIPRGDGPFPTVLVIHENRGLNPYVRDVARRAGVAGFLALAPDGLAPVGGYPGNDDEGRELQRNLDRASLQQDMVNSARWLMSHALSNGKLGATGFCWGGSMTNELAVRLGDDFNAGAPFYGSAPDTADVSRITAPLLVHYAGDDPRVNAMRADFEAALKAQDADYTMHSYPGTRHGFHNNSTPRYNEQAANLAWDRTVAFFRRHLA